MTGPTMTPSDMNSTPEHASQDPLDATTVEALLTGGQSSGDPALDAALDALRALVTTAPEPSGELASLLGPVAVPASGDELGRRRKSGARHVATGTTVVAGILLATATAAAAIGTLRGAEHAARPALPPAVVSPPSSTTPHPVGTTPTELPVLPATTAEPAHRESAPPTTSHPGKVAPGVVSTTPRNGQDADDSGDSDEPEAAEPGDPQDHGRADDDPPSTGVGTETGDDEEDSAGTGTGDHDDEVGASVSRADLGSGSGDDSGGDSLTR